VPYLIRKIGDKYRVENALTGKVHARATTLRRAQAQVRLLKARKKGG